MGSSYIKITSFWDYDVDDSLEYLIELSNGSSVAAIRFYSYLDCFKDFASSLLYFPKNYKDVVTFQIGEDIPKWAYYIYLKVYCYEPNGNSAIHILIDNHSDAPYNARSEFSIRTKPASINELGKLLIDWDPKTQKEFIWVAENVLYK